MATEYFQSSLLAQEMEDTWTGTVRFNAEQGLTEAQKAQARENIGAVPFGSFLKILGHFDTVAELQASAPQNVGDAYSVGATTPYNLYIYDGMREEWKDYGQIRTTDISARYVENQVIAVSAWVQDVASLAGYSYKAQITVSGATENDFPIVAFNQSDAVSGNFAPLSFSFDGYLEIFAKEKPTAAVTIPVATIIVNGGNGRGITNATGGITAGSIGADSLANGSVTAPKIADGVITRAKLANNALYSPIVGGVDTRYITSADIGKTLKSTWNAAMTLTITQENSANIPEGAEFAVLRWGKSSGDDCKIIADGIRLLFTGEDTLHKNGIAKISDAFGMIALKKTSSDPKQGDSWLVTGNAEVVT